MKNKSVFKKKEVLSVFALMQKCLSNGLSATTAAKLYFSKKFMAEGPDVAVDIISCFLMPPDFPCVVSSYSKEPVNVWCAYSVQRAMLRKNCH